MPQLLSSSCSLRNIIVFICKAFRNFASYNYNAFRIRLIFLNFYQKTIFIFPLEIYFDANWCGDKTRGNFSSKCRRIFTEQNQTRWFILQESKSSSTVNKSLSIFSDFQSAKTIHDTTEKWSRKEIEHFFKNVILCFDKHGRLNSYILVSI